jgi:hypothetical protein
MKTEEINLILDIVIIIVGLYLAFIKSYFKEKGKNLATLEDIGKITNKVEEVKHDFYTKIEITKKDLELTYYKISQLHNKRLKLIAKLYKKLVILDSAMREMTKLVKTVTLDNEIDSRNEKERIEQGKVSYEDFSLFYLTHRIFFPQKTCELIDKIKKDYLDSFWYYSRGKQYETESPETTFKLAEAASDKIRKEIYTILENIEKEFRNIISVTNE